MSNQNKILLLPIMLLCIAMMLFPLRISAESAVMYQYRLENEIKRNYYRQKALEDAELERVAIKDNWCARDNVQRNMVNYINEKIVPEPLFDDLKKQVKSVGNIVTDGAYTDDDPIRTIIIRCSVILHFVDGTTKSGLTGFSFPMNY